MGKSLSFLYKCSTLLFIVKRIIFYSIWSIIFKHALWCYSLTESQPAAGHAMLTLTISDAIVILCQQSYQLEMTGGRPRIATASNATKIFVYLKWTTLLSPS